MTHILIVDRVNKSFGGVSAVVDCSLAVEQGSITGLIGPNGSGKTTLFDIISGYLPCDSGTVSLENVPIQGLGARQIFRLGVGRTFQITRIFERLSLVENVLVATRGNASVLRDLIRGAVLARERRQAMDMLAFVGLAELATRPAGELSYGQRKLLELAYILVTEPRLLLLDEPAGGVNPTLINSIADRIRELNAAGTTVLLVEHNMEFVLGLCNRVIVLTGGTPIADGTPAEIREDSRVLDAYLGVAPPGVAARSTVGLR